MNESIVFTNNVNKLHFFFKILSSWAVSAVTTRQNQIVDNNNSPILAMIPLLDMCNHKNVEDGGVSEKNNFCFITISRHIHTCGKMGLKEPQGSLFRVGNASMDSKLVRVECDFTWLTVSIYKIVQKC